MRSAPACLLLATAVAAGALTGCRMPDDGSGSDRAAITVAATTTHVADLARGVVGDRGEVIGILPPNADSHDYEPKPSDAEAIGRADLVLKSGGDLDLWADELIESAGEDRPVDTIIDRVATVADERERAGERPPAAERTGDDADPHWWQDPRAAQAAVAAIRDRLIQLDPEGRSPYVRNAGTYLARLRRLDEGIINCIDRVPEAERKLVTTHDSLGYYADRYGVEIVGATIPALTTQAQPSAGETAELVDQIERTGVKAIFPESGLNPKLEEAIATETGARVGGALWADTLGPAGSSGATYIDAMASNTEAIVDGLTGGAESCRPRA